MVEEEGGDSSPRTPSINNLGAIETARTRQIHEKPEYQVQSTVQRNRCFNRRQSVEQESEPQGRSRALLRPQCRDRIHVQRAARRDDAGEETDAEHDEQVANQDR